MNTAMNQMNVFLRVFSSINRLFCEVRWLERNLRNSNSTVMLIVGGIICFCLYVASTDTTSGHSVLPPGLQQVLTDWGPVAIIALVVALFLYRRSVTGPMEGSGNINEVMFGEASGGGGPDGERQRMEQARHQHQRQHQHQSSSQSHTQPPQSQPPQQAVPMHYHPTLSSSSSPHKHHVHAEAVQYL
jgi:hypothetical protein